MWVYHPRGMCAMGEGGRWGLQCRGDGWVESKDACITRLPLGCIIRLRGVLAEKAAYGT